MVTARPNTAQPTLPDDDHLDRVFHAMADRTRRALMARLAQGPCTIGELAAPFAMSLPAVSKHIRVLEQGGLVQRLIDGRVHRCSLGAQPLQSAAAWLDQYRIFWSGTLDSLGTYLAATDPGSTTTNPKKAA
jgi:DNA-binding transcriptional ArsR family regulator